MKNRLFMFVAVTGMLAAMPALALDFHQARASGVVGEKTDGYVAAVKPSGEASALVAEVNAKRKAEYARISKQNGQPVNVVAKLAAGQIISNLQSGEMYQDASGSWVKK